MIVGPRKRQDRRVLRAGQKRRHFGELRLRGVQHDVLAFSSPRDALHAHEKLLDQSLLVGVERLALRDEAGLRTVDHLHFAQAVRLERRARAHEVADRVGEPRTRRHLDGTRQQAGPEREAALVEAALEQLRIARRDAAAVEALKPRPLLIDRNRDREAAAAEVEAAQHPEVRGLALTAACENRFLEHVFADDAQIHNPVHHEAGNVVVPDAQNFDRHVLGHR